MEWWKPHSYRSCRQLRRSPGAGNRSFHIFNGTASNDLTFDGVLTNGVLVKRGGGRMVMETTGGSPTRSRVVLEDGNLRFDAVQSGGGIEVNGGFLEASGVISGLAGNGGSVSPGSLGQPGTVQIFGALTLHTGVVCQLELNGSTAGSYDQFLAASPVVLLDQPVLAVTVGYNAAPGTDFVIIDNPNGSVQGQFAGLPNGAYATFSGQPYVISYSATRVILKRVFSSPMLNTASLSKEGEFQFRGVGDPNARYLIQASPDLAPGSWIDLGISSAAPSGAFRFDDTNAPLFPKRYYRALAQ